MGELPLVGYQKNDCSTMVLTNEEPLTLLMRSLKETIIDGVQFYLYGYLKKID